jgi:hypothetical protein
MGMGDDGEGRVELSSVSTSHISILVTICQENERDGVRAL